MATPPLTTIKVDRELRDVLKRQALGHGRTLGEHLRSLAEAEERRERMESMRVAMEENPPDRAYLEGARGWLSDAWS